MCCQLKLQIDVSEEKNLAFKYSKEAQILFSVNKEWFHLLYITSIHKGQYIFS